MIISASALSYESPTLPTEGSMPASAKRSVYGRKTQNGLTFHDFRRTFKTSMLTAGVEKVCRDAIVGHSLKGMDLHYLVLSDELLRAAMNQFTRWLDNEIAEAQNLLTKTLTKNKNSSQINL
jgi:integrase